MKNKIITQERAAGLVKDGMTVMLGGYLGCGTPHGIIGLLVKNNVRNLTVISNDATYPSQGVGRLFENKQVERFIGSHIGTNPEVGRQMTCGECFVDLIPQGTLAERIRCGGAGIAGFLTPTGIGTIAEVGRQIMELDGKKYILERPLRADVAILSARCADKNGNLFFAKSSRNFQPLMATAADIVIVEADEIVEPGDIEPECVHTPSIFVDYITEARK